MARSRTLSAAALASFLCLIVAAGAAAAWWCRSEIGDTAGPWVAAAWSAVAAFGTMFAVVFVVSGFAEFSRLRSVASVRD